MKCIGRHGKNRPTKNLLKAAVGNFGCHNFFVLYLEKKKVIIHKDAVSDAVWEYCEISVFSHHASVCRINKNPFVPVLFAQSVTLSVLTVLIGRSTLRFLATGDVGMGWLAVCVLCFDSPLLTTECLQCLQVKPSSSSWDGPVYSAAAFPSIISSHFKLDLKQRATANKVKCEPVLCHLECPCRDLFPL